ncbi:hypothetical protein ACVWWQ_000164 [Rhodanobacter sp. TND4EL1]
MQFRKLLFMCLTTVASSVALRPALADSAATPEAAARQYLAAEKGFDQAALANVIMPGFVEISPRGEIDEHDRVLSFYTAEQKPDSPPPVALGEFQTRTNGDIAVITTIISYALPGHSMTLSVGMTATRTPDGWKLVSAQYTPAKPKPSKPAVTASTARPD